MNFYIYQHSIPDTGEVFYLGKGTRRRAWTRHGRNIFWHNVVKKHGVVTTIVADRLSEREALELEVKLLSKFKAVGLCKTNLTLGGEGISGYHHAEFAKQKISARHKGKVTSHATKLKQREAMVSRFSGEKHPMARKVIDLRTGTIYETVKEASLVVGVKYKTFHQWINGQRSNKTSFRYLE